MAEELDVEALLEAPFQKDKDVCSSSQCIVEANYYCIAETKGGR